MRKGITLALLLTAAVWTTACSGGSKDASGADLSPMDVLNEDTQDAIEQDLAGKDTAKTPDEETTDTQEKAPLALRVMTFNVLCFFCDDVHFDPWEKRLDYFADIFERHDPDLIGLQELLFEDEVDAIIKRSPEYGAVFYEDDEQDLFKDYADATILFKKERFQVQDFGFYWLSETPDEPLSGGWADSNLPRMVTWAIFLDRTSGTEFYFASTHFDNNVPNQEMSAPLFVERTRAAAAQRPVIVLGDFNSKPDTIAYGILNDEDSTPDEHLVNSFDIAATWRQETNQTPPPDYDTSHRIDHIWLVGDDTWEVDEWVVEQHVYGEQDRYPSDHFPMVVDVSLLP